MSGERADHLGAAGLPRADLVREQAGRARSACSTRRRGGSTCCRTGEEIENSFAVDRDGVYIVSDKRMYRFSAGRDGRPRVDWSVRYRNSGIHKPSQVDAGSGTTPTILPGGYVAITDNADPMNVVVYRTAKRLRRQARSASSARCRSSRRAERDRELADRLRPLADRREQLRLRGPVRAAGREHHRGRLRARGHPPQTARLPQGVDEHTDPAPTVVPKLSTSDPAHLHLRRRRSAPAGGVWSWVAISARTGQRSSAGPPGRACWPTTTTPASASAPTASAYLGTIGGIRTLRDG